MVDPIILIILGLIVFISAKSYFVRAHVRTRRGNIEVTRPLEDHRITDKSGTVYYVDLREHDVTKTTAKYLLSDQFGNEFVKRIKFLKNKSFENNKDFFRLTDINTAIKINNGFNSVHDYLLNAIVNPADRHTSLAEMLEEQEIIDEVNRTTNTRLIADAIITRVRHAEKIVNKQPKIKAGIETADDQEDKEDERRDKEDNPDAKSTTKK